MIGLDTKVILRLLTRDDARQFNLAKEYLATHARDGPAFVNRLVLAETVWTLESGYGYTSEQIGNAVEALLKTAALTIEDSDAVRQSLQSYRSGADFSDALIGETNADAGCDATMTFDEHAVKKLGFQRLT